VAAYKAVQAHVPGDDEAEEGLDSALTSMLAKRNLSPTERAVVEALLSRRENSSEDNPPLSLVYERYFTERNLPKKTQGEWKLVLRRFTETAGCDLPVKSITTANVRAFKATLLQQAATGSTASKVRPLAPATIQKSLNGLRAVLQWAKKEGYLSSNPADGITQLRTKDNGDDRRLPFSVEQVRAILDKLPETGYLRWLWIIGLYSGARLAEIAGLRREDLHEELAENGKEGVLCFDIRPHEGRRLKNKASRRLVPVHPEILKLGFTVDCLPFKSDAHYYSRRVNPWLRKAAGITDPRLSYHSARHTVKDRLRAARVPEPEQRALMGHGANGVADGYGLGFPMDVLAESMAKVSY
jgi:integrase